MNNTVATYTTGTGQKLTVHARKDCAVLIDNSLQGCAIHAPSDHPMKAFPTHWRDDRGIMERICPHGVGHPDPDGIDYISITHGKETAQVESIHGCDGCCIKKVEKGDKNG